MVGIVGRFLASAVSCAERKKISKTRGLSPQRSLVSTLARYISATACLIRSCCVVSGAMSIP
eukprot:3434590-Pyramimonas_sp.AAC.1